MSILIRDLLPKLMRSRKLEHKPCGDARRWAEDNPTATISDLSPEWALWLIHRHWKKLSAEQRVAAVKTDASVAYEALYYHPRSLRAAAVRSAVRCPKRARWMIGDYCYSPRRFPLSIAEQRIVIRGLCASRKECRAALRDYRLPQPIRLAIERGMAARAKKKGTR